ncbi:1-deoxy-D-xylulose-5-phosphate synthase [Candidatus Poribacteria bacterium]|nr:1-deoxy-D-xylulose-5-phosphate synthase [Candidatus Poribacteria bacterium]
MSILEQIHSPGDFKKIEPHKLDDLSCEIRQKIISTVSQTGGHLASNLGVVELTIALHRAFDISRDKIVWDVGHQCYTHKILTGRLDKLNTIRQYCGLSGFPKRTESEYDSFGTGHACTAISAALGMALARDAHDEDHKILAVVGDGALTGGMAFEALNHADHFKTDMIVVYNDNEMSISPTIGGLTQRINNLRTSAVYNYFRRDMADLMNKLGPRATQIARKIDDSVRTLLADGMFFESLGLRYFGPVDGHDIHGLIETFNRVKNIRGPVVVHAITKKGKGCDFAEDDPTRYHSASPFNTDTGENLKKKKISYTNVFSDTLVELAAEDDRIMAITAAMPDGTGLVKFMKKYPTRCFDVGIAEQHAVTLAAGLSCEGMKPVVAIYSTFLQRAYDQIIHDVCLQELPVVFAVDRSGLVGADGPTHHGTFGFSFLRHIPNMVLMAPKDEAELRQMIKTAVEHDGPAALCYPRSSGLGVPMPKTYESLKIGEGEVLREGKDILLLAVGTMVYPAIEAAKILMEYDISAAVINARFIKPLDKGLIAPLSRSIRKVITVEENQIDGGFGSAVTEMLINEEILSGIDIRQIGLPDKFIQHGERELLLKLYGLTSENIAVNVLEMFNREEDAQTIRETGHTVSTTG